MNTQVTVVHTGTMREARQRWSAAWDMTRPATEVNSSRYGYGEPSSDSAASAGPAPVVSLPEVPLIASELTPYSSPTATP